MSRREGDGGDESFSCQNIVVIFAEGRWGTRKKTFCVAALLLGVTNTG